MFTVAYSFVQFAQAVRNCEQSPDVYIHQIKQERKKEREQILYAMFLILVNKTSCMQH